MATPTLEKSACSSKHDAADHDIQPERPNEQEESSYQTKKSSILAEEAALEVVPAVPQADESGRERLKRHRMEMGGRVWIPDTWGQENSLKNWIDCTAFDASLVNNSILSARAALMQQRATTRSANNLPLRRRIENRC